MVSQDPGFCKCRVQALNILTADSQNLNFSENILFFNILGAFFGECGGFWRVGRGGGGGVTFNSFGIRGSLARLPSGETIANVFVACSKYNTTEVQSYQN